MNKVFFYSLLAPNISKSIPRVTSRFFSKKKNSNWGANFDGPLFPFFCLKPAPLFGGKKNFPDMSFKFFRSNWKKHGNHDR